MIRIIYCKTEKAFSVKLQTASKIEFRFMVYSCIIHVPLNLKIKPSFISFGFNTP